MPSRAAAQAVGRRSGIGAEDEAGLAQTKDAAGGGPAEEQTRWDAACDCQCSRSGSPGLGCEDGMTFLNGSVKQDLSIPAKLNL